MLERLKKATPLDYRHRALEKVCIEQAVMWRVTGDERYARNAMSIIQGWAGKCVSFEGSNAPLELGWGVCSLVRAAEILRYSYPKWVVGDLNRFIDKIAMPKLTKKLGWTNNWQTTICEARLQIAIFRDDRAEFDWAVAEYRRIFKDYVRADGCTAETGRDLVHAQFGIGGLLQIPELVFEYSGGAVDLFDPLLARVCEVHADMIIRKKGKDPWFLPCGWSIALRRFGEGRVPNTKKLLDAHGPELYVFHWGLGKLCI
jgi:hypothetical protein